jgi:hypothetical protein
MPETGIDDFPLPDDSSADTLEIGPEPIAAELIEAFVSAFLLDDCATRISLRAAQYRSEPEEERHERELEQQFSVHYLRRCLWR